MTKTVLTLLIAVTPQTRATVSRAFRPTDFEIVWTANAFEAVEASARCRPDLLLLDLAEPLQGGWGILERLRTANPNAPVVVLTESKPEFDEALSNNAGAVLQKPVEAATLADTVSSLLSLPPAGVAPVSSAKKDHGAVIAESERFRDLLLLRYNTPYAMPPSHRGWGINE